MWTERPGYLNAMAFTASCVPLVRDAKNCSGGEPIACLETHKFSQGFCFARLASCCPSSNAFWRIQALARCSPSRLALR